MTNACDADYDYQARTAEHPELKDAIAKISLTGKIGKPLLTLHGTLDTLLPIRKDSDVYAPMVAAAGKGAIHRYYVIDKGNHVDSLADAFPDKLRPILPCYRTAFDAMTAWVEKGTPPPPSGFVPATGADQANVCALPAQAAATTASTSAAPTTTAAAPAQSSASGRSLAATGGSATLPATGGSATLPAVGLLLLALAIVGVRRRRG